MEIAALQYDGQPPNASDLALRWHDMLDEAHQLISILPPEHSGKCVLLRDRSLFSGGEPDLRAAISANALVFQSGSIRGALPVVTDV